MDDGSAARAGYGGLTRSAAPASTPSTPAQLAGLRELFGEIGNLKRIRSAGRHGSIAQRGFRRAWTALATGCEPAEVMRATVAAALAAARLGDLDRATLAALGLDGAAADTILRRGFDAVAPGLDPSLADALRPGLETRLPERGNIPPFVADLEAQPRAGATCPDKPRLVLEPPENHAEHCWAVAVYGVLLSPHYGAEPVTVFLAALAHHLHNAAMPDSGFTGEMLLGDKLESVCEHATGQALGQLSAGLRETIVNARGILPNALTAEGQAFHAADVIDRVLQITQHLRPASITMATVLDDLELVHQGPVKAFHDGVLAEMGLP